MSVNRQAPTAQSLRHIKTPRGLTSLPEILEELDGYVAVMAGDVSPPFDNGVLTLHETANAYYARAREIEGLIYRGEREGRITKNLVSSPSPWNLFRTGELQSYIALFRHADELGSRRLTHDIEYRDDGLH